MTVSEFKPKHAKEAEETLLSMSQHDRENLAMYFAKQFLNEIQQCLDGEIGYDKAPFAEQVDKMYEEFMTPPEGCYFCDRDVDGNETMFEKNTPMCLTCQLKVANLMKAFGIDPKSLFPFMGERKKQEILFEPTHLADGGGMVH